MQSQHRNHDMSGAGLRVRLKVWIARALFIWLQRGLAYPGWAVRLRSICLVVMLAGMVALSGCATLKAVTFSGTHGPNQPNDAPSVTFLFTWQIDELGKWASFMRLKVGEWFFGSDSMGGSENVFRSLKDSL